MPHSQVANQTPNETQTIGLESIDEWIDELDESTRTTDSTMIVHGVNQDVLLRYFVQQQLPKVTLPKFAGKPEDWVEFIVKFRDIVHKQAYLTDFQRIQLLLQHLEGEAKRSVKGYAYDSRGMS